MQGLKNLGSTCAINSLVQIICRNKFLRCSILNEDVPENTLAYELKELLKILHIEKSSVSPNKFINAVYNYIKELNEGEQIDITELWFLLNDKLASELNIISKKIEYNKEFENIKLNSELIHDKVAYTINCFNNNKTCEWLCKSQGVILNTVECNKCKNMSYNFEPFNSIQLDLPNSSEPKSLTALFRNYLKSTVSKDEWKCEKCKECTEYTKSLKLWKMPNVLIFLIKRYTNNIKKNNLKVDINQNINIKKGCILMDTNLEKKYHLTSIGMHIGNLDNGHYIAICKDDDTEKFILYDDLNIKVFNKDNIGFLSKNSEAYMVVYNT